MLWTDWLVCTVYRWPLVLGQAVLIVDPTERSSRYLAYSASVVDAKGLFILDKINGKPEDGVQHTLLCAVILLRTVPASSRKLWLITNHK